MTLRRPARVRVRLQEHGGIARYEGLRGRVVVASSQILHAGLRIRVLAGILERICNGAVQAGLVAVGVVVVRLHHGTSAIGQSPGAAELLSGVVVTLGGGW